MRLFTQGAATATPDEIRHLYAQLGLGQRETARLLQIDADDFRKYCSGAMAAPVCVVYALRYLVEHRQGLQTTQAPYRESKRAEPE